MWIGGLAVALVVVALVVLALSRTDHQAHAEDLCDLAAVGDQEVVSAEPASAYDVVVLLSEAGRPTRTWEAMPSGAFVALCEITGDGTSPTRVAVAEDGQREPLP